MGEKLQFTELDQYLFGQGTHYDVYRKLGAHPVKQGKKEGVYFAVWAPNAQAVSVIGEFNDWNEQAAPMKKAGPIGVFETFVPGAKIGQLYKFFIVGMNGEHIYKADPYANEAELRPGTASRITDIGDYKWKDTTWMKNRQKFDETKDAMAIYEVHPGSWMKHPATEENEKGFFNYRELAVKLAQYVKDMGYTHVELMGIAEHPFDGTVTTIADTLHAVGLMSDDGIEVLIHVGMDTVEMQGKSFEAQVKVDQKVKAGTPLLKIDLDAIRAAGHPTATALIVTNADDLPEMQIVGGGIVAAGAPLFKFEK